MPLKTLLARLVKAAWQEGRDEQGAVDEEGETDDLQKPEVLPAEVERDDPDSHGSAGIDGGASRGGDAVRGSLAGIALRR